MLNELLNASRGPLTQYTVLKCARHANYAIAKRAVAEKMTFIRALQVQAYAFMLEIKLTSKDRHKI